MLEPEVTISSAAMLDAVCKALPQNRIYEGMAEFFLSLKTYRASVTPGVWKSWVQNTCRAHPAFALVLADPFTRQAYNKPRGYPGDAGLLDYIYGDEPQDLHTLSELGRGILAYTVNAPASRAVRSRKYHLARLIDETAYEFCQPSILSLACGHLREAEHSSAVRRGRIGRLVAVDQDPESLAVVKHEISTVPVEARQNSVGDLLKNPEEFGTHQLVYTAGLYDYLSDKVAARLTTALFGRVGPGGRLLIANFLPDIPDVGYMEAVMDWWLIYRNESQMEELASGISENEIGRCRLWREENSNIVFMEIRRR